MKTRNFLIMIGVILMIIFACEDVIKFPYDEFGAIQSENLLDSAVCDTCETISYPPEDSIPGTPSDTTLTNPADTFYYPEDITENCATYQGFWICGMDDSLAFDYSLLPGTWNLVQKTTHADDQIDEYFGDSIVCDLNITSDFHYSEVLDGEVISEGTWEVYPALNNQLWLTDTENVIHKYYIIMFREVDGELKLQIARLDYDLPGIVVKIYRKAN